MITVYVEDSYLDALERDPDAYWNIDQSDAAPVPGYRESSLRSRLLTKRLQLPTHNIMYICYLQFFQISTKFGTKIPVSWNMDVVTLR